MNQQEKEAAQAITGVVARMMPYAERGELCPPQVLDDARVLLGQSGPGTIYTGGIRASDIALKRLAAQRGEPLTAVGEGVGEPWRS